MKVPFNVLDFLDRAEHVYGDRIGVDRRARPAGRQLGAADLAAGRRARPGDGRRPRRPRRRSRRTGGDRLAEQRPPPRRPVRRVRLRPRRRADQLPPQRRRGRATSSSSPVRPCSSSTPSSTKRSATCTRRTGSCSARESDDALLRFDRQPNPWVDRQRGRDRVDQLHERHDGPPEGRRADAPQPLRQRAHVRLARRRQRPRRLPVGRADVPLQRLGHGVRDHRDGRHAT